MAFAGVFVGFYRTPPKEGRPAPEDAAHVSIDYAPCEFLADCEMVRWKDVRKLLWMADAACKPSQKEPSAGENCKIQTYQVSIDAQ
jgi:hypothetical protein